MPFLRSFPSLILLSILALCAQAGEPGHESVRRTVARQARTAAEKSQPDAYKKALGSYMNSLAGVGEWLAGLQDKADAATLAGEIEAIDGNFSGLTALRKAIELATAPAALTEPMQKELDTRLKVARKLKATGLADLAGTCYRAGLYGRAYDYLLESLDNDSDNAAARQAFGYVKAADGWHTAYEAGLIQKGNVYVPELGWVPASAAERVKNGEWFENGRFLSVADADKLHSENATAWTIESQNFILKSTADRKQSVRLAERLEAFRQICYRQCIDFFMRGAEKRGTQMSFTQAAPAKMHVFLFAEKKDYEATVKKDIKIPIYQAIVAVLPGLYYAPSHSSYFNQDLPEAILTVYLQHEIARQTLMEYAQAPNQPVKAWLSNGVAEALEFAGPDADKKKWSLPMNTSHQDVQDAAGFLKDGSLPKLSVLLNANDTAFGLNPANAKTAGAFCVFLMDAKEGALGPDFMEFLFDSYRNPKSVSLSDYVGEDTETLEKEFCRYLSK